MKRPRAAAPRLAAGVVVLTVLWLLYWRFSGAGAPDWDGYGRLFDAGGGWLRL